MNIDGISLKRVCGALYFREQSGKPAHVTWGPLPNGKYMLRFDRWFWRFYREVPEAKQVSGGLSVLADAYPYRCASCGTVLSCYCEDCLRKWQS